MALTYEPIATTTLGTATASITFSSIAQTYTDLRVVFWGQSTSGITSLLLTLNGDTGANYSYNLMNSQDTVLQSAIFTGQTNISCGGMATSNNSSVVDIFQYTTTANYKSLLTKNSNGYAYTNERRSVGFWLSTAAVTSVTFTSSGGTLAVGTKATLFGIKAA